MVVLLIGFLSLRYLAAIQPKFNLSLMLGILISHLIAPSSYRRWGSCTSKTWLPDLKCRRVSRHFSSKSLSEFQWWACLLALSKDQFDSFCNLKAPVPFHAATKELLFLAYNELSTAIVVGNKFLNIFIVYICKHRKQNKENKSTCWVICIGPVPGYLIKYKLCGLIILTNIYCTAEHILFIIS